MSFLKRVGEGISISVVSMLFPFKHPALFLYPLICGAIALPAMAAMAKVFSEVGNLQMDIVMFMMDVVMLSVAVIFFIGLIRGSIARMEGRTIKFWKAMAVDGRMLICIFFLVLIFQLFALVAPSMIAFFHQDFSRVELESMGFVYLIAYLVWVAASFYFVPVISYETKNFFDAMGHSVKHFLHSFIEVIVGVFTSYFICGIIVAVGAFLMKMDDLGFHDRLHSVLNAPLPALMGDGVAAVFLLAVALILITGCMILVPGLYFYTTHKNKNPFTKIGRASCRERV